MGKFFFIDKNEDFSSLSPATVTKLIYLNTYLSYSDNLLKLTQRTPMKYEDLPGVLKISEKSVQRFWNEVSPKYIVRTDEGLMFTNLSIFIRGQTNRSKYYQKIYNDGIRLLYDNTPISKHKNLGYLFKMIPLINIEYNILCENPDEDILEKVKPITLSDFCKIIGYNETQLSRLVNTYNKIKFNVNGKMERFCAFVYDGLDRTNANIIINPRILYSGINYKKVEILGLFYRD